MIVLAATPQEKGKQLEALTMKLLRHRGYQNCTTNVMANGAEIDVRGELPIPGLGSIRSLKLICECKAHKTAMDMTQWCKFLGKVFHQEVCSQTEVAGCFISLSGVNGHVQGNYDEFLAHRKSVTLLHGDELLKLVSEIVAFVSLKRISQMISAVTDRTASRFEPAYHDGSVYWVVVFSDGEYTLLSGNGEGIEEGLASKLLPMLEGEIDVSHFVDIYREKKAKLRRIIGRAIVISELFCNNGYLKLDLPLREVGDFKTDELKTCGTSLVEDELVQLSDNAWVVPIKKTETSEKVNLELYRQLLSVLPVGVLHCDFYRKYINRELIGEVCSVQCNLPLREEDKDELVEILRLSPTALRQALHPIPMIVNGRKDDPPTNFVDDFHRSYFRQTAIESLCQDFQTPQLSEFYHDVIGVMELETTLSMKLKSEIKIVKDASFTRRLAIGKASESLGGGWLLLSILENSPQPWEEQVMPPSDSTIAPITKATEE